MTRLRQPAFAPSSRWIPRRRCDGPRSFGAAERITNSRLRFDPRENLICFLERFPAPDIEPLAVELERLHRFSRVEPLHKAARLIRIVASREIGRQKGKYFGGVIVKGNRRERTFVSFAIYGLNPIAQVLQTTLALFHLRRRQLRWSFKRSSQSR